MKFWKRRALARRFLFCASPGRRTIRDCADAGEGGPTAGGDDTQRGRGARSGPADVSILQQVARNRRPL